MNLLYMATVALACGLLASGCSKNEADAASAAASPPIAAQAKTEAKKTVLKAIAQTYPRVEIATDAGLFWFVPRRCSIGPDADSGLLHYSIEGAGQSPDGLAVYVTLVDEDSDPANSPEMRINVGTDQPFKTPEVVWISNDGMQAALKVPAPQVSIDQQRLNLQGVVFSRNGSNRMTATAPIRVDCTPAK